MIEMTDHHLLSAIHEAAAAWETDLAEMIALVSDAEFALCPLPFALSSLHSVLSVQPFAP